MKTLSIKNIHFFIAKKIILWYNKGVVKKHKQIKKERGSNYEFFR